MKTKNEPLRGEKLLKAAVNQILAHPETWEQTLWHSSCGTKHCIAGWCQILSGKPAVPDLAKEEARAALGISPFEADYLFHGYRTLGEIYYFAEHFSSAGYDRAGYDRAGYDRDGRDRDGRDRDGRDRDGRDRDGRDRDGNALKPFQIE
jgi:hypothetical protein